MPSEDGDVYVVKAGPKFERLATNPMGEPLMATLAISEGIVLVRGQNHIFAIAQSKCNQALQTVSTPTAVK